MRLVGSFEYCIQCSGCQAIYAFAQLEYEINIGKLFNCKCGLPNILQNAKILTYNIDYIRESLLLENKC